MSEKKIPSYSAKWLVSRLEAQGIPSEQILAGTNLSRAWLNDGEALISPGQYLTIVGNALDKSGQPSLGLQIGRQHNLAQLGIWGYAIISSPTLDEANRVAIQYWELSGSLVTLSYRKERSCSLWGIKPAFPMNNLRSWIFAVEELLSTFYSGAVFLSKEHFQIESIDLSYPKPAHWRLYTEIFDCPVRFNRRVDEFQTTFDFEQSPTSMGNPALAEICREQCRRLMAKLKSYDELIEVICNLLITSAGNFPRLPAVAAQMAMSPRTLRRRLEERNTTYQKIMDEIRAELGKEYIVSTNLSVEQMAGRLGFSEAAALRRAFKKWTGVNIAQFRRNKYSQ